MCQARCKSSDTCHIAVFDSACSTCYLKTAMIDDDHVTVCTYEPKQDSYVKKSLLQALHKTNTLPPDEIQTLADDPFYETICEYLRTLDQRTDSAGQNIETFINIAMSDNGLFHSDTWWEVMKSKTFQRISDTNDTIV